MVNILFLGCLYSEQKKPSYLKNSIRGYQFASQNFQEALLCGFLENGVMPYVLTKPSLSTFPMGYRRPFVRGCDFVVSGTNLGSSVGYINIPFLNMYNRIKGKKILNWGREAKGKKYVVVYGVHAHLMEAAVSLKKSFADVKLCLIAPDLPRFMSCNYFYSCLGLKERDLRKIEVMLPLFDGVVVLSKLMVEELGFLQKPHIVVEGIYSCNILPPHKELVHPNILLYTGGMAMRYGIGDLIDAFELITDSTYRLWLCGTGDAVPYVKEVSNRDKRIEYKGVLPKDEVIKLQSQAKLLVNPRHSSELFTNYSFPSKTMDYMASGTPTVMSHLQCIPQEYDDYLYYFEDESVEGMAKTLQQLCMQNETELRDKGQKAADFIRSRKNSKIQVARILELLKQI